MSQPELQKCTAPGCEIIPEPKARKVWEQAQKKGLKGFDGLCFAHCRDRVVRAKLAELARQKEESKLFAIESVKLKPKPRKEPPKAEETTWPKLNSESVTMTEASVALRLTYSELDGFIELGLLTEVADQRGRAISGPSVASLVEKFLLGDERLMSSIPIRVVEKIKGNQIYFAQLYASGALD